MGTLPLTPPVGNEPGALFGRTRNAVLGLLFSHPDESFYVREIVRAADSGLGSVQRELRRLERAGILKRTARERHVFYQANRQCPIFEEIKGLVAKTIGGADTLARALSSLSGRIKVAFIYGSMARGEQRRGSDVDVFIIGDVSFGEVVDALTPAQKKLAREVNPTVYPVSEFREKVLQKHHFITSVLRSQKLFLIGDESELAELGGSGLDPRAQIQP
jgi:predicted nucleotidyltransferase